MCSTHLAHIFNAVFSSHMGFGKQFLEPRLFLGWPIQSVHELLPLVLVEHKPRLIRKCHFRFFTGSANDKVGNVDSLPVSRNFDESFLLGGGAELESTVSWLFRCGYCHSVFRTYCTLPHLRVRSITGPSER